MKTCGGAIRRLASGRYQADRSEPGGIRDRRNFGTLDAAKAWLLDRQLVHETQAAPISTMEAIVYRAALAALPPGVSLLDAARYYSQHHAAGPMAGATLREVYAAHYADREAANLRPRSLVSIYYALREAVERWGDRRMDSIMGSELAQYVGGLRVSPASRGVTARYISGLWRFGARVGACTVDPLASLPRIRLDDPAPEILTPEAADCICAAAIGEGHGAAVAVALYAGLRTAELDGLRWDDVDLDGGHIRICPEVAKRRRQRLVAICPHLSAILGYLRADGLVARLLGQSWMGARLRIAKAAGVEWPRNSARHSWCSYHLALHQDAAATALQAGHTADVLFRSYRQLVTISAARSYFHCNDLRQS